MASELKFLNGLESNVACSVLKWKAVSMSPFCLPSQIINDPIQLSNGQVTRTATSTLFQVTLFGSIPIPQCEYKSQSVILM